MYIIFIHIGLSHARTSPTPISGDPGRSRKKPQQFAINRNKPQQTATSRNKRAPRPRP